jgi:hypothetical protein
MQKRVSLNQYSRFNREVKKHGFRLSPDGFALPFLFGLMDTS